VICGWSCLVLAVARSLRGVFRADTTSLLVVATIIIGCGLLTALFVPLVAGLNALLGALDGDAGRCFAATTRGQLKMGCLSVGGMRGENVAPSFGSASGGVGRHAERSRLCSTMSMALGHSCHHPLGVEAMSPSSIRLIVAWVLRMPFGPPAFLPVLSVCQGLITRASLP
jgi:hypothetical protein